jgi:hypothetical protein
MEINMCKSARILIVTMLAMGIAAFGLGSVRMAKAFPPDPCFAAAGKCDVPEWPE